MKLRVLIADDEEDYRLLVKLALDGERDITVVAEAATAAELVSRAEEGDVDLVLLDRSLPGLAEALAALRAVAPEVRFVLTSSLPVSRVAQDVAAIGAIGSLAKDVPLRQLAATLRELGALVQAAERALHTARRALPRAPESVPASRHMTRKVLEGWCDASVRDTALLLMSELVTNGVCHAGTVVDIRIAIGARHLRVEVADRNPALPVARQPEPTSLGGRGLQLVSALAQRWGVQPSRTGKVVWFELPRAAPMAAAL